MFWRNAFRAFLSGLASTLFVFASIGLVVNMWESDLIMSAIGCIGIVLIALILLVAIGFLNHKSTENFE